jgi:hypothetical protein
MEMAKVKKEAEVKVLSAEQLADENARLSAKVAELEATGKADPTLSKYMQELDTIKGKAKVSADKIKVVDITDHKNISLWTKDGKRIGPLHRDNAIKTLQTFYSLGVMLSATQPTLEEIAAYKETDEYKAKMEALAKSRARKEKSKRSGQIDKLTAAIAKMSGLKLEEVNTISRAAGVRPLAEGRG